MYGVDPQAPGAAEYYRSLFALYAQWGVDLVKVDDALLPYAAGEIELIRDAIDRCGRPMVLSLSCGPLDVAHGYARRDERRHVAHVRRLLGLLERPCRGCSTSAMHGAGGRATGTGRTPTCCPSGASPCVRSSMASANGLTRYTPDEQVTMLTLWCMVRSPLMLGCHLPSLDPWTLALLTNDEVLAVLRGGSGPRQVVRTNDAAVWSSDDEGGDGGFLAVFNTGFYTRISTRLNGAGLPQQGNVRDLWSGEDLGTAEGYLQVEVPSHGARLLKVTPQHGLAPGG